MAREDDTESQQKKTETVGDSRKIDSETTQDVCTATYNDKENGTRCAETYANFEIIIIYCKQKNCIISNNPVHTHKHSYN